MKNENYYTVQGWMVNELHLSGNELICYAIIYGFCQDQEIEFNGKATYVADWIGCTREYALKILKNLTDKGLIIRKPKDNHYNYTINQEKLPSNQSEKSSLYNEKTVNKVHSESEKSSLPQSEKSSLSLIDNIYINNNNYTLSSKNEFFDKKAMDLWNDIAEKYKLAKVMMVTPARHKALLARMKEVNIQDLDEFFARIRKAIKESMFLKGKEMVQTTYGPEIRNKDWRPGFDFFVCQPSSLLKALEGAYADPDLVNR